MLAINDNQTLAQFKARETPLPSRAEIRPNDPRQVHYSLMEQNGQFALVRVGMIQLDRRVPRQFAAFPVAAAPHPWCPEHTYTPPQAAPNRKPPSKVARELPSYLRVVA